MDRHIGLSALAVAAVAALVGALVARAAQQPPAQLPPGTLLTVAGTGKAGFSGDGGPATQAALNDPFFLAVDGAGNLFIGDAHNNRVRKVRPDGTIATVAGGGQLRGSAGYGSPATQVLLQETPAVAVDTVGDFLFGGADGNGTVRVSKVDAAGIITTVAGGGHPADGRGDGGLATDARLRFPAGLALDPAGNLYIADIVDNRVRRVGRDGKIATVAGGGSPVDGLGDGGPATDARLDNCQSVAVDAGGDLFIGENHGERIRKVSPAGIITTVAGTGQVGYAGDGGPATTARLNSPLGVCLDRAGNLFFSEGDRYTVDANGNNVNFETRANHLVREVIGVAVPR